VSFLLDNCTFSPLDENVLNICLPFSCGDGEHERDLNDFFINDSCNYSKQLLGKSYCFRLDENPEIIVCAFTVSNDSIKTNEITKPLRNKLARAVPQPKRMRRYPAVLIGRLGVNVKFPDKGIGTALLEFIKYWFIHPENKTGCRYIVVDSYNEAHPMNFYTKNGFDFFFKTEEEEATETGFSADTHLNTRLMYFDLIKLRDL
jgi:GNAT superfamily N-acetyltransferase